MPNPYDFNSQGTTATVAPPPANKYDFTASSPTPTSAPMLPGLGGGSYTPPQPQTPQPSPLSAGLDAAKAAVVPAAQSPQQVGPATNKAIVGGVQGWLSAWSDALYKTGAAEDSLGRAITGQGDNLVDTVAKVGSAAIADVGAFFQPFSVALNTIAASGFPVASQFANGVNGIFAGIGAASGQLAYQGLEATPFSQETKDKLEPIVRGMAALASQIALGKASAVMMDKFNQGKAILMKEVSQDPAILQTIKAHADLTAPQLQQPSISDQITPTSEPTNDVKPQEVQGKINTQRFGDVSLRQGELPKGPSTGYGQAKITGKGGFDNETLSHLIDTLPVKSETQNRIVLEDANHRVILSKDWLGKPVKPWLMNAIIKGNSQVRGEGIEPSTSALSEQHSATELPAPENDSTSPSNSQVTKAASDISESLVKRGIEKLTPEEQSTFTSGSYKDSAEQAKMLAQTDRAALDRMATTGEGWPQGVHPQIGFNVVEALAEKEGNIQLLRDLAKSPLGTQLSESGSTLGSHGYNDNPNSTVKMIQKVTKAREANSEKRSRTIKQDTVKEIKRSIRANSSTRETWHDFITKLTCEI